MTKKQLGFLYHQDWCVGCEACEIRCQVYHKHDEDFTWRKVKKTTIKNSRNKDIDVWLSRACNHCENPACLPVCPVGAYTKREDGIVVQDHDKCIGCKYCVEACPYDAINIEKDGKVSKCNLCAERIDEGKLPACVEGCPLQVLKVGEMSYADSIHLRKDGVGFKNSFTHPSLRFIKKENYK